MSIPDDKNERRIVKVMITSIAVAGLATATRPGPGLPDSQPVSDCDTSDSHSTCSLEPEESDGPEREAPPEPQQAARLTEGAVGVTGPSGPSTALPFIPNDDDGAASHRRHSGAMRTRTTHNDFVLPPLQQGGVTGIKKA
jgi:hypothetical protein